MEKPTKKQYSFEVKKEVVDRFLAGETRMDLAKKFELSSPQQVKDWVSKWHKGDDEALRYKPKGRPKGSAKPALLTEEDRLLCEVEKLRTENAYLKNAGLEEPPATPGLARLAILPRTFWSATSRQNNPTQCGLVMSPSFGWLARRSISDRSWI